MKVTGVNVTGNGTQYQFENAKGNLVLIDIARTAEEGTVFIQAPKVDVLVTCMDLRGEEFTLLPTDISTREGYVGYILLPTLGERLIVQSGGRKAQFTFEVEGFRLFRGDN